MQYVPPIGGEPDDSYVDAVPASGVEGSAVPASALEDVQREIINVVTEAGLTPDGEDLTQLEQAIAAMIAAGVPDASAIVRGIVELATEAEAVAGVDTERAVTPAGLAAALPASSGYDTAYIGGGAMTPSQTSGAYPSGIEDDTNDLTRSCMIFGTDADTSAEFALPMPDNWDGGTLKARLFWSAPSGSAGDDIGFSLAARALADDDALDQALGTAVTITDDLIAVGDLHISAASAAMTVAGTPDGGQLVRFKLTRDHDYGAAALAADVQVLGVQIQFNTSGAQVAW